MKFTVTYDINCDTVLILSDDGQKMVFPCGSTPSDEKMKQVKEALAGAKIHGN